MEYCYAQLDTSDLVVAVSSLSAEVIQDNLIPIESLDELLLGKRYNRDTGEFETPEE